MIGKVVRVSLPVFGWIYVALTVPYGAGGGLAVFICGAMAAYVANREAGL